MTSKSIVLSVIMKHHMHKFDEYQIKVMEANKLYFK